MSTLRKSNYDLEEEGRAHHPELQGGHLSELYSSSLTYSGSLGLEKARLSAADNVII
jgi:hypothetical protein